MQAGEHNSRRSAPRQWRFWSSQCGGAARALSPCLLVLLALGLCAACGGGAASDTPTTKDQTQEPTTGVATGLSVAFDGLHVRDAWARPARASENRATTTQAAGNSAAPADADTDTDTDMDMDMGLTTSAVYLTLENTSDAALRIIGGTSDVADSVELHQTSLQGGTGMLQMAPVPALEVPAHGTLQLTPGGLHIMLIGLTRDLLPGTTLTLTLTTAAGASYVLEGIPIREPGT